jgi:hypothetical protein
MDHKRFFTILVPFSLALFGLSALFAWKAPQYLVSPTLLLIVPFFFIVVSVSRIIFSTIVKKKPRQFTNTYFLITVFRFLLYIAAIITYALIFPQDAAPFIISFFIFYFLFTSLEVTTMYRELRP